MGAVNLQPLDPEDRAVFKAALPVFFYFSLIPIFFLETACFTQHICTWQYAGVIFGRLQKEKCSYEVCL